MDRHTIVDRAGLYGLLRALYTYPLTESVLEAVASLSSMPESPLAAGLGKMQARLQSNELMAWLCCWRR